MRVIICTRCGYPFVAHGKSLLIGDCRVARCGCPSARLIPTTAVCIDKLTEQERRAIGVKVVSVG